MLSQSQSRYKELFSAHQRILLHLNTVVLEFNQEGNIRFINPAWEHLTGYGIKSSLAKSLTDIVDQNELSTSVLYSKENSIASFHHHSK